MHIPHRHTPPHTHTHLTSLTRVQCHQLSLPHTASLHKHPHPSTSEPAGPKYQGEPKQLKNSIGGLLGKSVQSFRGPAAKQCVVVTRRQGRYGVMQCLQQIPQLRRGGSELVLTGLLGDLLNVPVGKN